MTRAADLEVTDCTALGLDMQEFAGRLYPICRSITGDGVRKTLARIADRVQLRIFEIASGTPVFDWTVPKEWNICDAFIADRDGERIVDFRKCNLHVMSYSTPVNDVLSFAELRRHLFTIPEHPEWIPYRTSYYKEDWGFCLAHNQMLAMDESADYHVCIDSTLADGALTYGECYIPGQTLDEVLISCHVCHPSLANDNLSGLTVATFLAEALMRQERHCSYRFVFVPGTIGAITWLAQNADIAKRIKHGMVLTCIGDRGPFHYKKSRSGTARIDRAAAVVLKHEITSSKIVEFAPYGYDERQYCSPGFNLPVGCLMRSVWGTFPEYHTSADNLDFICPEQLAESLRVCLSIIDVLENDRRYQNLNPYCEPQLGRRGLYGSIGGEHSITEEINARLWVLNFSDGKHSLLDIAERSGMPFSLIRDSARLLEKAGLLVPADEEYRPVLKRVGSVSL
jgi:aminopeptidase-like protein